MPDPTQQSPMQELKATLGQLHFYRGILFAAGEISRGKSVADVIRMSEAGMRAALEKAEAIKKRYGIK